MTANVRPELIAETLAAQGVSTDAPRAQAHAALTTTLLNAAAGAYAQLPFEQEPAAYAAELRRQAP